MILRTYGIILLYNLSIIASAAHPAADASKSYPKLDYLFWQGNFRALNISCKNKQDRERKSQLIKDKSAHIVAAFKAAYKANKPRLRRTPYYLFKKNGTIECYDDVVYEQGRFICGVTAQARHGAKQSVEEIQSHVSKSKIASYNIN